MTTTVFICNRGKAETVKVQLELPKEALEKFKAAAEVHGMTPKQFMEKLLRGWAAL